MEQAQGFCRVPRQPRLQGELVAMSGLGAARPEWLDAQIASVASAARIDRIYVAGFSGGASYLARWAPVHAGAISRVAFVSGGYPASDRCPTHPLSTLFLIGSNDPMIDLYVRPLAAWLGTCAKVEITWRVVPRLGHAAMHAALQSGRAAEIVSWLVDSR